MPDLKLYTITDLRNWLIDNNPPAGLNEHVIAPVRAYAILNNPYVKDDDAVVAAIYEDDALAAFTACFPDYCNNNRIWWTSTLWCYPEYRGKGYGLIVIGSLVDAHKPEITLDRYGANETVEIFTCLGYKTIYTSRYVLGDKSINRSTFKGKLAYYVQTLSKFAHKVIQPYRGNWRVEYALKYSTFVDGEVYSFMQKVRGDDLFLRNLQMINYLLNFPYKQGCPLLNRVKQDTEFSSNVLSYNYFVTKVYHEDILIGSYILRINSENLSIIAIYYESSKQSIVFASVVEHILKINPKQVVTDSAQLSKYLENNLYFPSINTLSVSFSTPFDIKLPDVISMQLIDGDSFA